jgi:hypothetical protein
VPKHAREPRAPACQCTDEAAPASRRSCRDSIRAEKRGCGCCGRGTRLFLLACSRHCNYPRAGCPCFTLVSRAPIKLRGRSCTVWVSALPEQNEPGSVTSETISRKKRGMAAKKINWSDTASGSVTTSQQNSRNFGQDLHDT